MGRRQVFFCWAFSHIEKDYDTSILARLNDQQGAGGCFLLLYCIYEYQFWDILIMIKNCIAASSRVRRHVSNVQATVIPH